MIKNFKREIALFIKTLHNKNLKKLNLINTSIQKIVIIETFHTIFYSRQMRKDQPATRSKRKLT